MLEVCVKHRMTSCNGRWEKHEKELQELNIIGPLTFAECPECLEEKRKEWEFLHRVLPAKGL